MKSNRYPCPCCGYLTYEAPVGGSMQLCPVCFWEDAPGEAPWNVSNSVSLITAQQNFAESGACEQEFADSVRPPLPGEERPSGWLSFQELAAAVITLIEDAFAEVSLGEGITIHQREAIDNYQSEEEFERARRLDDETRWQEIADEKIRRLGSHLTFLDPDSVRYHLPAFMRHALHVWDSDCSFGYSDMILYSLEDGPRSDGYHAESFLKLDDSQHRAVAIFLKFVSLVDPTYGKSASKGLRNGWEAWLPDSLHFSYYTTSHS